MALKGTGVDITLKKSNRTGRWDLTWGTDGNPEFSDDRSHLVLSLLLEFRGLWWADPDGRRGSTLYLIKQDVSGTLSQISQAVDLALQPAVDDGRLSSFSRRVKKLGPGKYDLQVLWTTPNGVKGSIPLTISS